LKFLRAGLLSRLCRSAGFRAPSRKMLAWLLSFSPPLACRCFLSHTRPSIFPTDLGLPRERRRRISRRRPSPVAAATCTSRSLQPRPRCALLRPPPNRVERRSPSLPVRRVPVCLRVGPASFRHRSGVFKGQSRARHRPPRHISHVSVMLEPGARQSPRRASASLRSSPDPGGASRLPCGRACPSMSRYQPACPLPPCAATAPFFFFLGDSPPAPHITRANLRLWVHCAVVR